MRRNGSGIIFDVGPKWLSGMVNSDKGKLVRKSFVPKFRFSRQR